MSRRRANSATRRTGGQQHRPPTLSTANATLADRYRQPARSCRGEVFVWRDSGSLGLWPRLRRGHRPKARPEGQSRPRHGCTSQGPNGPWISSGSMVSIGRNEMAATNQRQRGVAHTSPCHVFCGTDREATWPARPHERPTRVNKSKQRCIPVQAPARAYQPCAFPMGRVVIVGAQWIERRSARN